MPYILGVSFDYHDAAAALITDDEIIAAAQEERFSRKKNDPDLPLRAIQFCCKQAGISAERLDHVIYYENALLKLERIIKSFSVSPSWEKRRYFEKTLNSWLLKTKYSPVDKLADALSLPRHKISYLHHHQAHAASAFYCSPYDEGTVITLDGVGEFETMTISHGRGNDLNQLASVSFPHSVGLFYSAITAFLGFRVNEDEYKVMGMAGFGKPRFYDLFMSWFTFPKMGIFELDQSYFHFITPAEIPYTDKLVSVLGTPRSPESDFRPQSETSDVQNSDQRYADIAASVQRCTEEVILRLVRDSIKFTGCDNVCLSGGVALNSLANGRIKREITRNLYVQPAAGDAGSALGAALHFRHQTLGKKKKLLLVSPYLGQAFTENEIESALKAAFCKNWRYYPDTLAVCREAARLLREGNVIGWFQGRFEWGPRALGARSILANPTLDNMQDIVNRKVKFRERFRPFAPAVLPEAASRFFEMPEIQSVLDPEYFMLAVHPVREEKKRVIPAITHVDGTARVQLVNPETNATFYRLIDEFGKLTGVPILMNTSFNLRGEPIVAAPADAIRTFEWSGMDYLVLGNYLVSKD